VTDETETPEETPADGGFAALGLGEPLVRAVTELGYEEPTPIQTESIPVLLQGRDLLGHAATGTGKTAAFALPMLERLDRRKDSKGPYALVLVPTRELAMQVAEAIHRYGREMNCRVLPVYGGAPMSVQLRALRRGVDVVVATPGRALDHLNRGTLRLDAVSMVVLDEADEMLDMGFQEDLESILGAAPEERQMALFSATFPGRLREIAGRSMRDPVRVDVAHAKSDPGDMPKIRQVAYIVRRNDKRAALARILDMEGPQAALLFCRTRLEVDNLTEALDSAGYRTEALHGGLSQQHRDRVMQRLRAGKADLVVATDVAARGLDVEHLSHVINFDPPGGPAQYVHRIGRTGRAGREGVAITLLEPRERRLLGGIERATGQKIEVAPVPSVKDLHARRLDVIRERVTAALADGGMGPYRAVCDSLSGEHEMLEIAAAAIKALHQASWTEDEQEIPEFAGPPPRREGQRDGGQGGYQDRGPYKPREYAAPRAGWTKLFIGMGRQARIRPGDLMGAILNETGLPRDAVGNIEIAFNVSFVEVQSDVAERVIEALRNTSLRGRRVFVRRDRKQHQR